MHIEYVEVTISIQLNLHSQMLEYESFEAIQLLDPNSTFFVKHIPIFRKTLQVMIFKHSSGNLWFVGTKGTQVCQKIWKEDTGKNR